MTHSNSTDFIQAESPVRMGIDVGSTTVKVVALDSDDSIIYSEYERHRADIRSTIILVVTHALDKIQELKGENQSLSIKVTGSGGLAVSHWLSIPFIQEVVASTTAVQKLIPETDVGEIVSNVEKSKLPTYEKIASSLERPTKASVKTTAKRKTTKINQEKNEN